MVRKWFCGTLTMLLLPVGLIAQSADGRFDAYPGGPDMLSWLSDASRSDVGRPGSRLDFEGRASAYRYPYHRIPFSYAAFATGPPNWTPGLSYPYGYASSWYPYSSWHGLGDDNAFPNYDYNVYSPIPSVYGAPVEVGYRARTYNSNPAYTASLTSRVTITTPPGADVYLEGVRVASDGEAVHTFQTPPLSPEQQYRYRVRATWVDRDQRTVDQNQDVAFSAGASVAVRFPTSQTATRAMQAIEK